MPAVPAQRLALQFGSVIVQKLQFGANFACEGIAVLATDEAPFAEILEPVELSPDGKYLKRLH